MPEPDCTCPYTDPSTWLSAASCGYGSGYEPGSMQEWDPDCPQHPAAPETETDANGLTEAEQTMLWEAIERAFLDTTAWSREVEDEIDRTVERIVAERVRVVEGERDAARKQGTRLADGLYQWRDDAERYLARAESAEAAHEAEKAAHERLRGAIEKKAALYSQFADREMDPERRKWLTAFVGTLRLLLGGGGAR